MQALGYAGVCVAVYAGIKADLAALHVKCEQAIEAAKEAHKRIDQIHIQAHKI
jgi:hypothetical protein